MHIDCFYFKSVVVVQKFLELFQDKLNMFLYIFVIDSTQQFALTASYQIPSFPNFFPIILLKLGYR